MRRVPSPCRPAGHAEITRHKQLNEYQNLRTGAVIWDVRRQWYHATGSDGLVETAMFTYLFAAGGRIQ
jgi:hypothetical protein